jgi:hypothetical protein
MNRFFTKSFFKFFFSFLIIIAVAFGILLVAASNLQTPVDPNVNVAHSQ